MIILLIASRLAHPKLALTFEAPLPEVVGTAGSCRIVRTDKDTMDDKLHIYSGAKEIWSGRPVSGDVDLRKFATAKSFAVSVGGEGLHLFRYSGKPVATFKYASARDPRPIVASGRYIVWGEGVYNFHELDAKTVDWLKTDRTFRAADVIKGTSWDLPNLGKIGLPLALFGKTLVCLVPSSWATIGTKQGITFDLLRLSLTSSTRIKEKAQFVSRGSSSVLTGAICGWGEVGLVVKRSGKVHVVSVRSNGKLAAQIRLPFKKWLASQASGSLAFLAKQLHFPKSRLATEREASASLLPRSLNFTVWLRSSARIKLRSAT